jgi:outer membrane protein OmpA-like peptidoglycan-associated protein
MLQKNYRFLCVTLALCLYVPAAPQAAAEEFFYTYQPGNKYRILSTVYEEVYIDSRLSHKSEILNRIAVEVLSESGGSGYHKAIFQSSEHVIQPNASGNLPDLARSYQWEREYESEFAMDRLGYVTIDKKYFMPVVRDVPVFTGRDIKPGEKWSRDGHEMHDFRDSFGIREPYRIPFTANYEFLGDRKWKGNIYPAFSVSYRIQSEPRPVPGRVWPKRITSSSDQIVYWDTSLGQPVAYSENFKFIFELSDGRTIEYRGKAEAEVVESIRMDKEQLAEEIAEEINRLDIPDVSVRVVDEGITISLDDIQFQADTAIMLPGEREKLDKIVDILLRYQDRDILVGGHTALAGTKEGRMKLSAERAGVIADYIIGRKARMPDRIVVRGYGADRPLASNSTEEGRRRNRRVEITILEN